MRPLILLVLLLAGCGGGLDLCEEGGTQPECRKSAPADPVPGDPRAG